MSAYVQLAFVLAQFCLILLAPGGECNIQRLEWSLVGPFDETQEHLALNWLRDGDAQFGQYSVVLTPDEPDRLGSIWNTNPIFASDWEVQVQFRIHGKGANLFGNGIAFWYAKDPMEPGPVFGSKNHFSGLGIFIDTMEQPGIVAPHYHPYVSAMVNNGTIRYSHDEDGTFLELGSCFANVRNKDYVTRMAIAYIQDTLSVYIDVDGFSQWVQCFSSPGVHLPTGYFFGISASTGEMHDSHEVISVTTLDMNPDAEYDEKRNEITPHAENIIGPKAYAQFLVEEPVKEKEPAKDTSSGRANRDEAQVSSKGAPEEERKHTKSKSTPDMVEDVPPRFSWTTKLAMILILVAVSYFAVKWFKGYSERRKEMMEKRLY